MIGKTGKMCHGQGNRLTYVQQLLRNSCCATVVLMDRTVQMSVPPDI